MKKIIILFSLFLSISAFISSCTKSDDIISNNTIDTKNTDVKLKSIYVKEGRLVFKDSATFIAHLKWIQENQTTPEVIEAFNENMGIKSLNACYQKGLKLQDKGEQQFTDYKEKHPDVFYVYTRDSAEFVDLPCPRTISFVANEKGIFQVGNLVSKVMVDQTVNNSVVLKYKNEVQVAHLSSLKGSSSELKNLMVENQISIGPDKKELYYETIERGGDYKINGRLVCSCTVYRYNSGYVVFEATSLTQRKYRFIGWRRNDLAGSVGISYNSTYMRRIDYGGYSKGDVDLPGKYYYMPETDHHSSTKSGSKITVNVFQYNRNNHYDPVALSKSYCQVTHTGADRTYFRGLDLTK